MSKSMVFRVVGNILVTLHGEQPPSDEDFDAYVEFIHHGVPDRCRACLVVTPGPGPNSVQRQKNNDALKARGLTNAKVAVVTEAPVVRGIVTALSWFNPQIKAFPVAKFNDALAYLGASPQQAAQVAIEVRKMGAMTGYDPLKGLDPKK